MSNLIKYDFLRIVKDKLFLVSAIISGAVGIGYPLLLFFVELINKNSQLQSYNAEILEGSIDATMTFAEYYKPAMYLESAVTSTLFFVPVGFILLLLMSIAIGKDCQQGTIRNKLIIGKTRPQIYFSNLIVTVTLYVALYAFALVVALITSLFTFRLGLGIGWAKEVHIGYVLIYFALMILTWITIATIINLFAYALDKPALAVVTVMVCGFLFGMIIPMIIPSILISVNKTADSQHNAIEGYLIFDAFNYFKSLFSTDLMNSPSDYFYQIYDQNTFSMLMNLVKINNGQKFNVISLALRFVAPIMFSALHIFLGYVAIKRRNYK